jgi:hypothetical protein
VKACSASSKPSHWAQYEQGVIVAEVIVIVQGASPNTARQKMDPVSSGLKMRSRGALGRHRRRFVQSKLEGRRPDGRGQVSRLSASAASSLPIDVGEAEKTSNLLRSR